MSKVKLMVENLANLKTGIKEVRTTSKPHPKLKEVDAALARANAAIIDAQLSLNKIIRDKEVRRKTEA